MNIQHIKQTLLETGRLDADYSDQHFCPLCGVSYFIHDGHEPEECGPYVLFNVLKENIQGLDGQPLEIYRVCYEMYDAEDNMIYGFCQEGETLNVSDEWLLHEVTDIMDGVLAEAEEMHLENVAFYWDDSLDISGAWN